jgi:hypothetical protein
MDKGLFSDLKSDLKQDFMRLKGFGSTSDDKKQTTGASFSLSAFLIYYLLLAEQSSHG